MYRWRIGYDFKDVLTKVETDTIIKEHQQEWLNHIIIDNIFSDKLLIIFEFICEIDEDTRRNAIKLFLDNNQDFEIFSKLSLVPNHWSCWGSLVPV